MPEYPTLEELEEAIGVGQPWGGHCHEISLAIVKAEIFPVARVARGGGRDIGSQHSWVVLGDDCYDQDAMLCEPTMWAWPGTEIETVWYGTLKDGLHHPHGQGHIFGWGRPKTAAEAGQNPYVPKGYDELSREAKFFLDLMGGQLSYEGWCKLLHAPVEGWPAKEIITMCCEDPQLRGITPIDIEGMLTDRNPGGLYLVGGEVECSSST